MKTKRPTMMQRDRNRDRNEKRTKSAIREWFDSLLYAGIAALILKTFFFDAFRIPTPSIEDS